MALAKVALIVGSVMALRQVVRLPRVTTRMTATTSQYTLDDVAIGSAIEPLGNYLLVRLASTVDSTSGGVLLPDNAKEKPTEGVVVACGPGRTHPDTGVLLPMPVSVSSSVE